MDLTRRYGPALRNSLTANIGKWRTVTMDSSNPGPLLGRFKAENAEYFAVSKEVDRIYFFNPFSLEILQKVMHKILESYYENPREMKLLFYYPSDEYISYLMTVNELMFADEIDCRDLFQKNDSREKIVIFEL